MNIQLPQFSEEIVDRVLEKCEFLIEYKYWDTISETELHSWIENFETKEDRYLAAIILDSIIFRNKKSISTFGANIFQIIIPQFLSELKIYEIDSIESWEKSLRSPECRNLPIRFSAIENVDRYPAKSSSSIFRDLTDYFNKQIGIICTELATLPEHIKCVVFFDDILGTGSQFETFVKKYQLDKSHLNFLYIPLAAIRESVERINTMYSNIKVYPVEFIDPSCSFFSGSSPLMNFNEKEHSAEFLSVYTNICKKNNIKLKNSKGRGR